MGSCLWVQAVWYNLLSVLFFLLRLGMLILSLPLLRLNSKPTSLNPELCVARTRQYNAICWKFDLFSGFYVFSWLISGVAWRRWEMLSQRLAADPRYKLNISSFLTLPHPLDCLIFAKDISLCQGYHHHCVVTANDGGIRLGVVHSSYDLGGRTGSGYHIFSIFCSVFVLLLIVLLWLVHDSYYISSIHDSYYYISFIVLFCFLFLWSL